MSVCLYSVHVCIFAIDNFQKRGRRELFFGLRVHLHGIRVKFVYEGHQIKVKVTAAEKREISPFPQCKISVGNNPGYIEDTGVKFACGVGFLTMAYRMA